MQVRCDRYVTNRRRAATTRLHDGGRDVLDGAGCRRMVKDPETGKWFAVGRGESGKGMRLSMFAGVKNET